VHTRLPVQNMNIPLITRRQLITKLGCLATGTMVAHAAMAPSGVETEPKSAATASSPSGSDVLTQFSVREQHLRLTQVMLQDQSDQHNELVQTREWLLHPCETVELTGNLFVLEQPLTGEGRILLKLEPLPHARPVRTTFDLRIMPRTDTGFDVTLFGGSGLGVPAADSFVDLAYAGGVVGRTRVLQQFQRQRRPASESHHTPRFLSNTWGDRNRDSRISQEFIQKEIEAGARLGVEVVQIDDGWQSGLSKNSARAAGQGVWEGFWQTRPDFWTPDPKKFPDGLQPLIALAKARDMEIGLWFAPDSVQDFANWEKDAACLIAFHRDLGLRYFKIDSVHARTAQAHANLRKFFSTVLQETRNAVVFDLDVTASLRPGYFGALGTGPLFVENRYTDWHRYWPHQTLRNLWLLAWWVDPSRLRMEFLNQTRQTEKYPADPLAPARYDPAALFATVFFSNPLGWFETSNLPENYFSQVAPLVQCWKNVRAELFTGTIIPLGQAPDGIAWTGFASLADDGRSALVLVFRELNPTPTACLTIPGFTKPAVSCTRLAGQGEANWNGTELKVTLEPPLSWCLVRLRA
jgi:alpha-galactosidase